MLAAITPSSMPWVALYWVFAILLLLMVLSVLIARFPSIELKEDEKAGSKESYLYLFKQKYVWLFFLGIFCYVSTEQGTADFMSTFLSRYHGVDPQGAGAHAVSYFWLAMTFGCILGMILLKLIDSRKLLWGSGFLTVILLLLALFGNTPMAIFAFPAVGFSISMMYSIVFSLGMNTAPSNHGSFAGILCSSIVGGAIGPLIISALSDVFSLRIGMCFIFLTVGYMTFLGFWSKPLINNKTITIRQLFSTKKQ
jgi:fucose permease